MVRSEVIRKRINQLDETIHILKGLQVYSFSEYMQNPERYGSTERFLQLAIEAIIDIGNHIIADEKLGTVDWYSDIPKILEEKGYIDQEMCQKWLRMIGFRNILVHEYLEIDREIVYRVLQDHLVDIEALRNIFTRYL